MDDSYTNVSVAWLGHIADFEQSLRKNRYFLEKKESKKDHNTNLLKEIKQYHPMNCAGGKLIVYRRRHQGKNIGEGGKPDGL